MRGNKIHSKHSHTGSWREKQLREQFREIVIGISFLCFIFVPSLLGHGDCLSKDIYIEGIKKTIIACIFPGIHEKEEPYSFAGNGNGVPDYFYHDEEPTDIKTSEALLEDTTTVKPVLQMAESQNPVGGIEALRNYEYLLSQCYVVDSTTYMTREEMNIDALLGMDFSMNPNPQEYQILIYHTHSTSETFVDSREGVLEDTTVGLGDTLTALLEDYGYGVYHDRRVYDCYNGKIDRNYAYTASGDGIDEILAKYPSIEMIIDLHRDGVNENTHLVTTIDGRPTAKIMFFNGVSRTVKNGELTYLENPYRQENLAFSLQLYLAGMNKYPELYRKTYIKGYQYNLNRKAMATLIEVGGQTNTLEEANNAMIPLAETIHEVLSQ